MPEYGKPERSVSYLFQHPLDLVVTDIEVHPRLHPGEGSHAGLPGVALLLALDKTKKTNKQKNRQKKIKK